MAKIISAPELQGDDVKGAMVSSGFQWAKSGNEARKLIVLAEARKWEPLLVSVIEDPEQGPDSVFNWLTPYDSTSMSARTALMIIATARVVHAYLYRPFVQPGPDGKPLVTPLDGIRPADLIYTFTSGD